MFNIIMLSKGMPWLEDYFIKREHFNRIKSIRIMLIQ